MPWTKHGRAVMLSALGLGPRKEVEASDGYPPADVTMPELTVSCEYTIIDHSLSRVFRGAGAQNSEGQHALTGLMRYASKANREYMSARTLLIDYCANPRMATLLRATDEMENCINAVHKSVAFLLAVQRSLRRGSLSSYITPQLRERLREIRNSTEHMLDRLEKGELTAPEAAVLQLKSTTMALGPYAIQYQELATVIDTIARLANDLTDHHLV